MSHAKWFHNQDTVLEFRRWCVCSSQWSCVYAGAHAPFNFNVKGMLQASWFMGSWCWEWARITLCVCVCMYVCVHVRACVCVCVCVWRKRGNNESVHWHVSSSVSDRLPLSFTVSYECNGSDLLVQCVCATDTWWVSQAHLQGMYVRLYVCWQTVDIILCTPDSFLTEELTKCAILMFVFSIFWSVRLSF